MILKTFENEDRLALACPVFTKGRYGPKIELFIKDNLYNFKQLPRPDHDCYHNMNLLEEMNLGEEVAT